jgi:hypothetical protein
MPALSYLPRAHGLGRGEVYIDVQKSAHLRMGEQVSFAPNPVQPSGANFGFIGCEPSVRSREAGDFSDRTRGQGRWHRWRAN